MKISKERLRQIIKEEVSKAIQADRIMKPDVWKTLDAQQWIDHGPDEGDLLSGRSPVEYGGYYENARTKEEWKFTLQDAIDNYGKYYAKGKTLDSPEAAQEAFYEATKEIDGMRRDEETMGYSDEQIEDMYYFDDDEELEEVRKIVQEEIQADLDEAKKKKKKKSAKDRMKCNSPRRIRKGEAGHGKKKFVVKACKDGKEKIIRYGDAKMEIKKDSPERRKSFRARHKCDTAKDKMSARYWSCKKW